MNMLTQLSSSFHFDIKRYLRSPALLLVALAVPIAAHYMVPDEDASYAVLTINGMKPVRSASVLGLELGVLAATLLTPLAYIFLRAGPTRNRPWQVTDVAPHSRILASLGRWAADTASLWMLLAALTAAGLIIGLFRLEGEMNIFRTVTALWLPAAPALAVIAAIRLFLDARNLTRRWLGDIIFFILWMMLMIIGIIGADGPDAQAMTSKPLTDAFGFTTPLINSMDGPVSAVTIGGAANTDQTVTIDAWRSITRSIYLQSRLFWFAAAAGLAALAGLIWGPQKTRLPKRKQRHALATDTPRQSISDIPFTAPVSVPAGNTNYVSVIKSEIRLILKSKVWLICLLGVAVMGGLLPFRTIAGPAILLVLIFPLTEASSRWQSKSTGDLLDTLGTNKGERTLLLYIASVTIALATLLPALIRILMAGQFQWLSHIGLISFAMTAFIIGLGTLTRSAVSGRILMLIIWYVYLSSGGF